MRVPVFQIGMLMTTYCVIVSRANYERVVHNGPKVLIKSSAMPMSTRQRSDLYEIYLAPYRYIEKEVRAVAVLSGNTGARGVVYLSQAMPPAGAVFLRGNMTGLQPGRHGFHIHEYGDLRNGCDSAGEHYNPYNFSHSAKEVRHRHAGDLGNVFADSSGFAEISMTDKQITLLGARSVVGRSLVVHEKEDDLGRGSNLKSLKNGNSGPPVACGIIGILN